jgi:glycerol uptake operon antiterminator
MKKVERTMEYKDQKVIPAIRNMKDFEIFIKSSYKYGVLLDIHIAQLKNIVNISKQHCKNLLLHVDLIHGLKNDEYATEYLCQSIKPFGLLSTKASVILKAKQKGVLAIQRVFLIDSNALEKSYSLLEKTKPDVIEVLPGAMPKIITEIHQRIQIPIFAGGFIRSIEDVNNALQAGATAVTTSNKDLWNHFEG